MGNNPTKKPTKRKKTVGRPKKYDLDPSKVEELAEYGCTDTEIASFFELPRTTLERNYEHYLTKGRECAKIRLRKLQWKSAERGSVPMLIWLGKQLLGQSDKQEITTTELPEGFNVELL